ncbi:MAG: CHASE2 domain-containing protein [Microcoleaceae cyanobacterium]
MMNRKGEVRSFLWQWRGVGITAPTVAILIILLRLTGILQFWEWGAYDTYLRHRIGRPPESQIVIVGVDETDLQRVGQAIIPDGVYAELLKRLQAMQPRAIGLNIYRDLPVPPGHEALVEVFQKTPNLVGVQKVVGEDNQEVINPPPSLAEKGLVGASDLILDADYRVRRGLLYLTDSNDQNVFSFGFLVALLYLETEGITPETIEGTNQWQLGTEMFVPLERNDGSYIRADDQGYQLLLNYQGARGYFDTVSLMDVIEGRVPSDWGRDRIILVGSVGESLSDLFATPYSGGWLTYLEPMSGVEIQAHLANQIIQVAQGNPLSIQTWSELQEMFWILIWSGIGAVLAWRWRYDQGQFFSLPQLFRLIGASVILITITYIAFLQGWWIPVVPPLLALISSMIAITGYMAHKASTIRETFGRYLSNEVVAELLESNRHADLEARRQNVTVLTADLKGFTVLSEQLIPEDVVYILNIYLKQMSAIIAYYQGTIDKYTGDGIIVIFGAPHSQTDDALRAVACAIAMQQGMVNVNRQLRMLNFPTLEMGIGINTGEAVVGNIGSDEHVEYTAIGYEVNLSFQIESGAVGEQILISEATRNVINAHPLGTNLVLINAEKQVKPLGMNQNVTVYEVGGIGHPYNLFLSKESEQLLAVKPVIPVRYLILEGKHTTNIFFEAVITQLSIKGAEVEIDPAKVALMPPLQGDIKLNLLKANGLTSISEDIYARVIKNIPNRRKFYIRFVFKPSTVATYLENVYQSLEIKGDFSSEYPSE